MDSGSKKPSLAKLYSLSETIITKPKLQKTIAQNHEDWGIRLKIIRSEAEILNNALAAPDKDLATLDSNLNELNKKLKALCKEIQKCQTTFAKKQADINTKLLSLAEVVDNTNQLIFDALKVNCKKIGEGLRISKMCLDTDSKMADECLNFLKPINKKVASLLLPQSVNATAEKSTDLKERLEAIINITTEMTPEAAPNPATTTTMKAALTLLRDRCNANVKLADLATANINKVYSIKDDSKEERKEEPKKAVA